MLFRSRFWRITVFSGKKGVQGGCLGDQQRRVKHTAKTRSIQDHSRSIRSLLKPLVNPLSRPNQFGRTRGSIRMCKKLWVKDLSKPNRSGQDRGSIRQSEESKSAVLSKSDRSGPCADRSGRRVSGHIFITILPFYSNSIKRKC